MIFENLPAATEYLAQAVCAAVAGSTTGFSNQSCSAYVRLDLVDEDGDYIVNDDGEEISREVRFSDHGDRNPALFADRITININNHADELTDADGDFAGFEIADWRIAEMIETATAHLKG